MKHSKIETKRKRLTIDNAMERVCRRCDNLTLHYQIRELGNKWICSRQVNGLRRRGIAVEY